MPPKITVAQGWGRGKRKREALSNFRYLREVAREERKRAVC